MLKKNKISILVILILVLVLIVAYVCLKGKRNDELTQLAVDETGNLDSVSSNINNYSEEFMNNYFEEIKQSNSDEEKQNMLIVISEVKLDNTYGAKKIIEAPNNQYILQFNSEEEKNIAIEKINKDNIVTSVEENYIYTVDECDYNSWGIEKMNMDYAIDALNSNYGHAKEVIVAIIDTGCDIDLFNKYYNERLAGTYNILEKSYTNMTDENGHGTHIAGTIAEGTAKNVKIFPIKVSTNGKMYSTDIIAAINYATYIEKVDIINMSYGCYVRNNADEEAINVANKNNIICVAAAGNDNTDDKHYPSSYENTISIASLDSNLNKSEFSNYGAEIDFSAPGTEIKSIMSKNTSIAKRNGNQDGDDDHEIISGTSMATPHAVAAIAMLKSYNKNLTKENIIDLLKDNAIDLGEEGWDQYFGYGLISFDNVNFCENITYHDDCMVYKELNKSDFSVELNELKITSYNYYSDTNLMASKININYVNGINETVLLGDIQNSKVLNYDPTSTETQEIIIKIGNTSINVNVTNPKNFESGWEYDNINQSEIKITGYKENNLGIKKLYIPDSIDSKKVVSFDDDLRLSELSSDFDSYTYLYLPNSFKRIGNYSLYESNIQYVYGSDAKVEIGSHSFESSKIETIDTIITKVESYGFKDCLKLKSIDLSGIFDYISVSNTEIGETTIEDYAFCNCKELSRVEHSKYETVFVRTLGSYAFYNCISLLDFGLNLSADIGEYAFYNTFKLSDIDLVGSSNIGKYAFYESGITNVSFSISMEIINESAFENCRNLKKLIFNGKRIEKRAFWNSGINEISIYKPEYIAEDAFAYSPIKTSDGLNPSDGSYNIISDLGIIKDGNKLIVGFTDSKGISNVKIPSNIIEIGNYAFTGNDTLNKIVIPSTIEKIGEHSFEDCYNLSDVYFLGNDIEVKSTSFKRTYDGEVKNSDLIFYVYKNSNIKKYAVNNKIEYRHIDPDKYEVINLKDKYYVGQSFSSEDSLKVKLTYYEEETREEIVSSSGYIYGSISKGWPILIEYQNPIGCFKYGDTYIKLTVLNQLGYVVCNQEMVPIIVEKGIPQYTVPNNLTAVISQSLSEIELPEGFEWMDESIVLTELGIQTFYAKYIPENQEKYAIVENIEIKINVEDKVVEIPNVDISLWLFNATYYADMNQDLKNIFGYDEIKLRNHYYSFGIKEGRIATPIFDVKYYLNNNVDLKNAFGNNYELLYTHFLNYGVIEGRKGSKYFNVKDYYQNNEDVKNVFYGNYTYAVLHFAKYGLNEGRIGSNEFSIRDYYDSCNQFVKNKLGKDYIKFYAQASGANLAVDSPIDISQYILDIDLYYALNVDLQIACGYNVIALKNHYYNYGIKEGRVGSYVFDAKYYLDNNLDLKAVFGNNYELAYLHFVNYGINEGRCASKIFDVKYYLENNCDLENKFYSNYSKALVHFVSYGINECRNSSNKYSVNAYKVNNADLFTIFGDNYKNYYYHFMVYGEKEGRVCI